MSEDGGEDVRLSAAASALATAPHSGNGTLTGGGVCKIYGKRMSLSELSAKSERRVALTLLICLAVNVTVFTMHAVMHSRVHSTLIDDIRLVRSDIEHEAIIAEVSHSTTETSSRRRREANEEEATMGLPSTFTPSSTSTSTTTGATEETEASESSSSTGPSSISSAATATVSSILSSTTSTSTTGPPETGESTSVSLSTSTDSTTLESASTTSLAVHSTTSVAQEEENEISELTVDELDDYEHILQTTYNTLTTFALLNAALLVAAIGCLYLNYVRVYAKRPPAVRIALKAFVLIALIFLFVELTYLIHPLLYYSLRLRDVVDALFASDAWPQSREFMRSIQERFVCTFPFESLKSEYTVFCEDDCSAKLKDNLLPTYAVMILFLAALIPFALIGGTWLWNVYAKDRPEVRRVRDRFANTAVGRRAWRESSGSSDPAVETVRSTNS